MRNYRPLAAYFRVREDSLYDMQVALNQLGVLYACAWIHEGWFHMRTSDTLPAINPKGESVAGAHTFAVIGYNAQGFIVLNTWGGYWGKQGQALLTYGDWLKRSLDVWAVVPGVRSVV